MSNLFPLGPPGLSALERALTVKRALRRLVSGRANPRLILTTRVGKLEPGAEAVLVEREPDGRHVWLRTPYTLESFRRLDPDFQLPEGCRLSPGGDRLEVRYLEGGAGGLAPGPATGAD